ncbi:uncharacterized protein LOC112186952 isoform X2 [Rosa chinensis]|uniref:uncharacterized protein LOC112186952 isoform X2 n=1 Tax=Rosa chinensis TaxID=74649 RepID=UPI001AD8A38D|nr:uncharacterized protein LOC112186952 isoform X2 [Rosa chinensis]
MDDQIRSVYLTLHYHYTKGVGGLLHEIKIRKDGKVITKSTEDKPEPPSRKLFDETELPRVPFIRCERMASMLYIYAGQHVRVTEAGAKVGYIFDAKAPGDLVKFDPPYIYASDPKIMAAHGRLYHLASLLAEKPWMPMPFELYDPTTNSWDPLTPAPNFAFLPQSSLACSRELTGYAVWASCILLSLWYPSMNFKQKHFVPVVFNAELGTWHEVKFDQEQWIQRFPFFGKAAVVGDTIYAFGADKGKFISFSIKKSGSEEDGTLIYSLTTPYELEGLKIIQSAKYRYYSSITECWAPLGDLEFCLVQTMDYWTNRYQPLFITTFKIIHKEGKNSRIETIHSTLQFVSTKGYGQFWITFGYCPDYEPKEAMLTTTKDIRKERNRIKDSSQEVDSDIQLFEPKEESSTNEKVDIQNETSTVKCSPCKVECLKLDFELGGESATKIKGETNEIKNSSGKVDSSSRVCVIDRKKARSLKRKVKRSEKKRTKRDSYIVSLVKRQVSTVKSYGRRAYVPIVCLIILFIGLLYGLFSLPENREALFFLGKGTGI